MRNRKERLLRLKCTRRIRSGAILLRRDWRIRSGAILLRRERALFAVHPFGDYRQRYTLTVDVDGTPTPVTLSGKWPSLMKLPTPAPITKGKQRTVPPSIDVQCVCTTYEIRTGRIVSEEVIAPGAFCGHERCPYRK